MNTARKEARGTLGEKQIRWLRANIPSFDPAYKAVQAADAHAEKVRAKLESANQGAAA